VSKGRGIDGMVVTKWDTVDDKAGFLLSAAHPAEADVEPWWRL
jgi:signal recognition particle GTPase